MAIIREKSVKKKLLERKNICFLQLVSSFFKKNSVLSSTFFRRSSLFVFIPEER